MPLAFPLVQTRPPFAYQYIAEKAGDLRMLGMSVCAIARALGVTDKTVTKALRFAAEAPHDPAQD